MIEQAYNPESAASAWQLDIEPPLVEEIVESDPEPLVEQPQRLIPDSTTPPPLDRIMEALFFVTSEPLESQRLCQIIRGLDDEEFQQSITRLNQGYRGQARPFIIERHGPGYRLGLRVRFRALAEKLHGGIKEARFSPAAIETLAVIAYRQPLTKLNLDNIRGQESDGPLRQLLRRGLITQQGQDEEKQTLYCTTPRFLGLFHLKKLEELPRADDLDRL